MSPPAAVETGGVYNPQAEEDLQRMHARSSEMFLVYLEDGGRTAAGSPLAQRLPLPWVGGGTGPPREGPSARLKKGKRCGAGAGAGAGGVGRSGGQGVTVRNGRECPHGKRRWEQSCESKSGFQIVKGSFESCFGKGFRGAGTSCRFLSCRLTPPHPPELETVLGALLRPPALAFALRPLNPPCP